MRASWISLAVVVCSCGTPSQPDVSDGAVDVVDAPDALDAADTTDALDAPIDAALDVVDVQPDTSGCDMDHDGHRAISCGGDDCNDSDPNVYPGAPEYCDGVDQNCDGVADQTADGGTDPAADTECDAGSYDTQFGTYPPFSNASPVRCYLLPTAGSAPCQVISNLPLHGLCEGCWYDMTHPTHCWAWTDVPGVLSGYQCH